MRLVASLRSGSLCLYLGTYVYTCVYTLWRVRLVVTYGKLWTEVCTDCIQNWTGGRMSARPEWKDCKISSIQARDVSGGKVRCGKREWEFDASFKNDGVDLYQLFNHQTKRLCSLNWKKKSGWLTNLEASDVLKKWKMWQSIQLTIIRSQFLT